MKLETLQARENDRDLEARTAHEIVMWLIRLRLPGRHFSHALGFPSFQRVQVLGVEVPRFQGVLYNSAKRPL